MTIYFRDILWIQVENKTTTVFFKNDEPYSSKKPLSFFLKQQLALFEEVLQYASRDTLVNIQNVKFWCKPQGQYILFFDEDKTVPEQGILVSHRNGATLISKIKKWRNRQV